MSEEDDVVTELKPEMTPGYKPPARHSMMQIVNIDKEDESLEKYKRDLLGDVTTVAVVEEDNPNPVIIKKMEFLAEDRPPLAIDLTIPKEEIQKVNFAIKEGVKYRIRISFHVQREIVTGLKYVHVLKKMGLKVANETFMVGSYGPRMEVHEYTTPVDELPGGMVARGKYKVHSMFTDDDGHELLKWDWGFELNKEWD